jgi:radical SAM/Cys-rich protein
MHDSFADTVRRHRGEPLRSNATSTLQINVGKVCNQACHHCHVDAGPKRTESMAGDEIERILTLLAASPSVRVVDITGGAPELNPGFRSIVRGARALGLDVVDRCNLTVLYEPGREGTAEFLASEHVAVVCSLPCYSAENVERQRGKGVFDKSIAALQRLNRLGYAQPGTGLTLHLVYNPVGATLPPPQRELEDRYRHELATRFGIVFDGLFTITNMPIKRFADQLRRDHKWEEYMSLLVHHFNAATIDGLMCRSMVSVAYDGSLYDCDFNQMLEIPLLVAGKPATTRDIPSFGRLDSRAIATGEHCFGCTAGAGSSCGGAVTGTESPARAE